MQPHQKSVLWSISSLIVVLSMLLSFVHPQTASAQGGDDLKRQVNPSSGRVSFIGPENGRALPASKALGLGLANRPEDPGLALAKRFGPEFGLKNPGQELAEVKKNKENNGKVTVKYQQKHEGIPVMGGELIVNTNEEGDLYSINGEVSPELSLSTQPTIDPNQARQTALEALAKWYQKSPEDFVSTEPELWIYDESLLQPSTRPVELTWRMEVTAKDNSLPARELVLVNAQRGSISLHFNQIDTAWTESKRADDAPTPTPEPTETPFPTETAEPEATIVPVTEEPAASPEPAAAEPLQAADLTGVTRYVATNGNDSNSCSSANLPCATINGAIGKASNGDSIKIAAGTYVGSGDQVVLINKSVALSGGWDAAFTSQTGKTTIDGQDVRRCVTIDGSVIASVEKMVLQRGMKDGVAGISISSGSTVALNTITVSDILPSVWAGSAAISIASGATVTLNNSAVIRSGSDGISNQGTLTVNNSSISNSSWRGIWNYPGTLILNNSTLYKNSWGGILNEMGKVTVNNSTISDNYSSIQNGAGGIYNVVYPNSTGSVTLSNTILANNSSSTIAKDCAGPIVSTGYNLIGNTSGCTFTASTGDLTNVNARLKALGGFPGYQPLEADSPAVNAGNPALPGSGGSACLATDARGVVRPVGARCDIGAYEYTVPGPVAALRIVRGDNQHAGPGLDFALPLEVEALDGQGTPLSNVTVTFTAPSSGASILFNSTGTPIDTRVTNYNGIARSSNFKANAQAGSYTVTASATGAATANFNLENLLWYVAPTGNDSNSCTSPASPCASLNAAIAKAEAKETILIAEGVYSSTSGGSFNIGKPLTLRGGWNNTFTSQLSITTLRGSGYTDWVLYVSRDATIERLRLQNGAAGIRVSAQGEYVKIKQSAIFGNHSGIDSSGGSLTVENTTISGNSGPGIAISSGSLSTVNSTITGNSGTGINRSGGTVSIQNSILSGNSNQGNPQDCSGTFGSAGNNIIGTTYGCGITTRTSDLIGVDPKIGVDVGGYHPLTAGSPAVGKANPGACPATDQRGVARLDNGACDIGAYEYTLPGAAASLSIHSGSSQTTAPNLAFFKPLRVYILDSRGVPVPNVSVTFTAPASGASGVFSDSGTNVTSILTDPAGVATAPVFTANSKFGSYSVSAAASGIPAVNFSLANLSWYVAPSGNDSNNCASPATPCATINGAVAKAADGDTVEVAEGIYTGTGTEVVVLDKSLNLLGGWDAAFSSQTGYSTIDGQSLRRGIKINPGESQLSRFKIQNCIDSGLVNNGSAVIDQSIISRNSSSYQGGGLYNSGILVLKNSSVVENQIRENAGYGGGIYNGGSLTISNTSISGNQVYSDSSKGGGIFNGQNLTINNSSISGNQVYGDYASEGGGIYNGARLTITNTVIFGNRAGGKSPTAEFAGYGGGIYNSRDITISNTTISRNTAYDGAGLYNDNYGNGNAKINSTTVAENTASSVGGGIFELRGNLSMGNSIVARNTAPKGASDCFAVGIPIISNDYNMIGNTDKCDINVSQAGHDKLNINAQLSLFIPVLGFVPLGATSPAIDAGNPAAPGSGGNACPATDQRGVTRPVDGPDADTAARCDIGAFEYTVPGEVADLVIGTGSPQMAAPNTKLPTRLQVAVVDRLGTPKPNISVTFNAPASGPGGTFIGGTNTATIVTDASGVATAPDFVANGIVGNYKIVASVVGLAKTVEFSIKNAYWYAAVGGSDLNDCTSALTACATIHGVLNKPDFTGGNTIFVKQGVYKAEYNLMIQRNVTLSGGWDASFASQTGTSILENTIAVYYGVTATVENVTVRNIVGSAGISNLGTLTLKNSSILNNYQGIFNEGSLTIINSTISGNGKAGPSYGGGLDNQRFREADNPVQVLIINSTITDNYAHSGGGIFTDSTAGGTVTLQNSIVAGNTSDPGYGGDCQGGDTSGKLTSRGLFISLGGNLIGNIGQYNGVEYPCRADWMPTDIVGDNAKPILANLDVLTNAGNDRWIHRLKLGSPAIEAVLSNDCPSTDQLGISRPQGAFCDIGAVEFIFDRSATGALISTYNGGNSSNLPGTFVCDQSDVNCAAGDAHAKAAHKYAIGTYNLYKNKYNRNSIDNAGFEINSTVHYSSGYGNAFWNGYMMVYGDKYGYPVADDLVAHELTHGVTQYESNLLYYYQSGAISESLSDLWGEYYDQTNGQGNDADEIRWRIGENISGIYNVEPKPLLGIRDMSNPTSFGDPDKMSSSLYYRGANDNGGVHWNSGIGNKAVFLMVDGGLFNGKTVTALGWDKTAAIYYEANTNLLTTGADYSDLYYVVQQACQTLIGQKGITAGDCAEVKDAVDAVEMNAQPVEELNPDAPLCTTFGTRPKIIFADDLENGTDNWTFTNGSYLRWQYDSPYGPYAQSGNHSLFADDYPDRTTDAWAKLKSFTVPANAYLHFAQAYEFEVDQYGYYDGGVLEYSTDGGATWTDAAPLMTEANANGYRGTIATGYSNPLSGRRGFVGSSHGYISTRLNLSSLAGKSVTFRWRMGLDKGGAFLGWWVDNVKLYNCVTPTISGNAGASGVTLSYFDGTAKSVTSGSDGSYALIVSYNWSGMVTPTSQCFNFTPASRSYNNVTTDQTNQNYTATPSAPCVSSIVRKDSNPISPGSNVGFTVTFTKLVTGVDLADFSLNTAGGIQGASITDVTGSDTTYTVTVNTGSGSGSVRLDLVDDDSIKDAGNTPLAGVGVGNGNFTNGERYNIVLGADTVGVFRPSNGVIFLKNTNTSGYADIALNYGIGGDYPIIGDWDGNGTDTIGVYRGNTFLLRNSNTVGFANLSFVFGQAGDQPVAGDWNGDGIDTIGVFRPSKGLFLLRNSNSAGEPDLTFYLGNVGDVGIAGDWDGDGIDTTGVFRPSNGIIFLKNKNVSGYADVALNYGLAGDKPVVGDWDNNGTTTIGIYRGGKFYLRNSNTNGYANITLALGNPGDMPIAGNWDGKP